MSVCLISLYIRNGILSDFFKFRELREKLGDADSVRTACGFPDGVNSYGEFQIAINWFKENSATFEYAAFRGESKYYNTFCKPAIARQDKDLTREYTEGHIITDQEVEFVLLNFGDHVGHNIFFHSQHFGSLTRLLDVSKAKEVALYFACNSNLMAS